MRKIPQGAEASNVLVGEVDFLEKPLSAFIRLSQATFMGDLTEVPVPTRFIFILLGPVVSRFLDILQIMLFLGECWVFALSISNKEGEGDPDMPETVIKNFYINRKTKY